MMDCASIILVSDNACSKFSLADSNHSLFCFLLMFLYVAGFLPWLDSHGGNTTVKLNNNDLSGSES